MNSLQNRKFVKILLTGGGTGGPVTPLLAVVDQLKETKFPCPLRHSGYGGRVGNLVSGIEFVWIGTKTGPERKMVESEGIYFRAINSGKLRRYFSFWNFVDPVFIILGFIDAFFILKREQPNLVLSAGGFVGVPVAWAAWILRIHVIIHQMDARPGLANKLMAPIAKTITVAFEKSLDDYGSKAVWIGSPIRSIIKDLSINKRGAIQKLGLNDKKPVVFVIGGGTGSSAINKLILKNLDDLLKISQIIHITGKDRDADVPTTTAEFPAGYHPFEFMLVDGMAKAYTAADIVVSRCGMGVLTELSELGKPSILIPMTDTHQEENATVFAKKDAVIVMGEKYLTGDKLIRNIDKLLNDEKLRDKLGKNIKSVIKKGAGKKMVEIILKILSNA